ncbi:retrovirus-related pol polyprotein from transposon TNT 1-94 [Tanacetum coccineum]
MLSLNSSIASSEMIGLGGVVGRLWGVGVWGNRRDWRSELCESTAILVTMVICTRVENLDLVRGQGVFEGSVVGVVSWGSWWGVLGWKLWGGWGVRVKGEMGGWVEGGGCYGLGCVLIREWGYGGIWVVWGLLVGLVVVDVSGGWITPTSVDTLAIPYFSGYLEHVVEYQCYRDEEHDKVEEEEVATESPKATKVTKPKAAKVTKPVGDKATKPTSTQTLKPKPAPTQPSKAVQEKKQKLVKETPDEPSPVKRSKGRLVGKRRKPKSPLRLVDEPSVEGVSVEEPAYNEEEANIQRALELSLQDQGERTQGPARPVVIREPDSRRLQPLPEAGPNPGNQDEGQAGPNPGDQDEDQAGSNPGDAAESQPQSSHVVPAGPNLEHMDLEATDASTQQKPEQMDEEFTTTAYPNVQENLKLPTKDQFFVEKPQEEEPGKTNAEAEVQSMVSVPIHQDTSSVPPMTTPVIDLTKSQSDSPLPTSTATISTITTTTTTLLPQP